MRLYIVTLTWLKKRMGKSLLNTHIAGGGRVVINNQFAYTASVLGQMAAEGVTGFSGVPSTYAHLLFRSPLARYRDKLPALRYCSQAGGHLSKYLKLERRRGGSAGIELRRTRRPRR